MARPFNVGDGHLRNPSCGDIREEAIRQGQLLLSLDVADSGLARNQRGVGFWMQPGFVTWQALRRHPHYQRQVTNLLAGVDCDESLLLRDCCPRGVYGGEKYKDWSKHVNAEAGGMIAREVVRFMNWADSKRERKAFSHEWGLSVPVPPWVVVPHPQILAQLDPPRRGVAVRVLGDHFQQLGAVAVVERTPQVTPLGFDHDGKPDPADCERPLPQGPWVVVAIDTSKPDEQIMTDWKLGMAAQRTGFLLDRAPRFRSEPKPHPSDRPSELRTILPCADLVIAGFALAELARQLDSEGWEWPTEKGGRPDDVSETAMARRLSSARAFVRRASERHGWPEPSWSDEGPRRPTEVSAHPPS